MKMRPSRDVKITGLAAFIVIVVYLGVWLGMLAAATWVIVTVYEHVAH